MREVIGRYDSKSLLDKAFSENKASLIAVYRLRRIGKTYLVKAYMNNRINFHYSGLHNVSTDIQIEF